MEPTVNALTTVRRDEAMAAAREAEARHRGRGGGEPRSLEGLPVDVAGALEAASGWWTSPGWRPAAFTR